MLDEGFSVKYCARAYGSNEEKTTRRKWKIAKRISKTPVIRAAARSEGALGGVKEIESCVWASVLVEKVVLVIGSVEEKADDRSRPFLKVYTVEGRICEKLVAEGARRATCVTAASATAVGLCGGRRYNINKRRRRVLRKLWGWEDGRQ